MIIRASSYMLYCPLSSLVSICAFGERNKLTMPLRENAWIDPYATVTAFNSEINCAALNGLVSTAVAPSVRASSSSFRIELTMIGILHVSG
jgi:hypothetical protein